MSNPDQQCCANGMTLFSLVGSVIALLISGVSAFLTYTTTPLYEGSRPILSYFETRENTTVKEDSEYVGQTRATVENLSRYPAKDVQLVFFMAGRPEYRIGEPKFHCSTASIQAEMVGNDQYQDLYLVSIPKLPAMTSITVEVAERMKQPSAKYVEADAKTIRPMRWMGAANVYKASFEYGPIKEDVRRSRSNVRGGTINLRIF